MYLCIYLCIYLNMYVFIYVFIRIYVYILYILYILYIPWEVLVKLFPQQYIYIYIYVGMFSVKQTKRSRNPYVWSRVPMQQCGLETQIYYLEVT